MKRFFTHPILRPGRILAPICLFVLLASMTAHAQSTIDIGNPGITSGTGWTYIPATQIYTITGDGVTITGNVTGATVSRTFVIDAGKTATWTATLSGSANPVVTLDGGGTLDITGGVITHTDMLHAIHIQGNGTTLSVSGGTVSVPTGGGYAINVSGTNNTVNVSGTGRVEQNDGGTAIFYNTGGTVNISGGTVSSNFAAIYLYAGGTVNVTGGLVEASHSAINTNSTSNISVSGGTVTSVGSGSEAAIYTTGGVGTVTVNGGSVLATGSGYAINTTGDVTVTEGFICSKTGLAISASGSVDVLISGGAVFSYGTAVGDVIWSGNGFTAPSGVGAVIAWDNQTTPISYTSGTRNDLFMLPAGVAS